jgi:hypothetical protein
VAGKLVELLKEMVPDLARIGLLYNPENISAAGYQQSIEAVAKSLGVAPVWLPVRNAVDIENGVNALVRSELRVGTFDGRDYSRAQRLDRSLSARYRLPAVYSFRADVTSGGLMCYGPDTADLFRRASSYVDRILKRREASRVAGAGTDQIRACHQPQDGEGARSQHPAGVARARRRSDRIVAIFAAVHAGAIGGGVGGQILSAFVSLLANAGTSVDVDAPLAQSGGGVAGAILTAIIGLIRNRAA